MSGTAELEYLQNLRERFHPSEALRETIDDLERFIHAVQDPVLRRALGALSTDVVATGEPYDTFVDACADVADAYALSPEDMIRVIRMADIQITDPETPIFS